MGSVRKENPTIRPGAYYLHSNHPNKLRASDCTQLPVAPEQVALHNLTISLGKVKVGLRWGGGERLTCLAL